jgi:hypothetical protein
MPIVNQHPLRLYKPRLVAGEDQVYVRETGSNGLGLDALGVGKGEIANTLPENCFTVHSCDPFREVMLSLFRCSVLFRDFYLRAREREKIERSVKSQTVGIAGTGRNNGTPYNFDQIMVSN